MVPNIRNKENGINNQIMRKRDKKNGSKLNFMKAKHDNPVV